MELVRHLAVEGFMASDGATSAMEFGLVQTDSRFRQRISLGNP
jgi:hypothetical protein